MFSLCMECQPVSNKYGDGVDILGYFRMILDWGNKLRIQGCDSVVFWWMVMKTLKGHDTEMLDFWG